ncbi:aldolase/citrate lyase family protein [Psychrosphaera algicola]|uniref:Aldolase/citrate lyase family protein n=1 Tax=Psychrosphaera algicola TaxID=3023714 RepID=A0ABT5FJG5_9GAMM|nr:aldolase/citrate lyase family protein [Psychrosphaera sp. G1-22]MDC2891349.1 aldolase/citrate lyase family protein [Psychrosphaera sp. G1-22]
MTNKPDIALYAERCGVDRIFIDLEILGKVERQGHLDTVISRHSFEDIKAVSSVLSRSEVLVRINPFNSETSWEIEQAIKNGASIIMLPMIRNVIEVAKVGELIAGRVRFMPLIETVASLEKISEIEALNSVDELHLGLNDLHIEMNLRFMFELFTNGVVERAVRKLRKPFGIGGVSKANEGLVKGSVVIGEHIRLGSTGVILARAFHEKSQTLEELKSKLDLDFELNEMDKYVRYFRTSENQVLLENQDKLNESVRVVVASMLERNN